MLISDSPDYTDAYIALKVGTKLTLKNNGFFRCISKINNTSIDNAEDNGIVMSLYKLLQYSDNYSLTSGSLWNYYRDEINDDENENDNNNRINYNKTTRSKSFEYKTKTTGRASNDNNKLDTETVVPLKYLSTFWRSFDLPLINCEIELDLSYTKQCIISNSPVLGMTAIQTKGATFQINNAIL